MIAILFSPAIAEGKKKSVELILPERKTTDPGWGDADDLKNLEILKKIDSKHSEKRLREASEFYRKAIENFQNAEKLALSKREEYESMQFPEDRYEWQKRERRELQEKEIAKILWDARNFSIQYLIRGMDSIDSIQNPRIIQSENFRELKAGLYREYIKHQYSMKNYNQTIDMANRYILLDDIYYNESEPHRILAVCYEKLEESAKKNKKADLADGFREKKKHHLITYAELHYGKESEEYQTILEKIMKDY